MVETFACRIPRFIFLTNAARDDGAPERFGWRMIAANNRPIARGVGTTSSIELCRNAAVAIHRGVAEAGRSAVFDVVGRHWTWRVANDGVPAAVSVHAYSRRVECSRALTQFLAALEMADPMEGVVRDFGPNSLRAYEPMLDAAPDLAVSI